jgi:membrane protease YdiL (CAAX protease family)
VRILSLAANLVALAALVIAILERRAPRTSPLWSLLIERFRKPKLRDLLLAAGAGAVFVVIPLAIAAVSHDARVMFTPPASWVVWIGLSGALALVALLWAAMEELIFRGTLLPVLARYLPRWSAVLVSAVVFALAHLERQGSRTPSLMTLLDFVLDGTAWSLAFLATGTLWVPTVWHAAKNLTVWLLVGGSVRLASPLTAVATDAPRWYGPEGQAGVLDVIVTAIVAVVVLAMMWRKGPTGRPNGIAGERR